MKDDPDSLSKSPLSFYLLGSVRSASSGLPNSPSYFRFCQGGNRNSGVVRELKLVNPWQGLSKQAVKPRRN